MTSTTLIAAKGDVKLHPAITGLDHDILLRQGHALPDFVDVSHPDLDELIDFGTLAEPVPGSPIPEGLGDEPRVFIRAMVEKYEQKHDGDDVDARAADPDSPSDIVLHGSPNLLTIGGASQLIESLMGNGTATAAQALTFINNGNAYLEVGDSTTAAADTQTALQATTNKLRKVMDSTYPQHTDSTSSAGAKSFTLRATFATTDANWAWQEWGIFNASTVGRMFNRKVESLGTKTSAASWVLTITLSFA